MASDNVITAMIAGAEKAGTTSLAHYLAQHPRMLSHLQAGRGHADASLMEFPAFVREAKIGEPVSVEDYFIPFFGRQTHADEIALAKSVGVLHVPGAAEALARHNPACKLIVSLRNPVERAYSAFQYHQYRGVERAHNFAEVMAREWPDGAQSLPREGGCLRRGMYAADVARLMHIFGAENVHVLLFEEMKVAPVREMQRVFAFLGLEEWPVEVASIVNQTKTARFPTLARLLRRDNRFKRVLRPLMPADLRRGLSRRLSQINAKKIERRGLEPVVRQQLMALYAPYNQQLAQLIGRDLDLWETR